MIIVIIIIVQLHKSWLSREVIINYQKNVASSNVVFPFHLTLRFLVDLTWIQLNSLDSIYEIALNVVASFSRNKSPNHHSESINDCQLPCCIYPTSTVCDHELHLLFLSHCRSDLFSLLFSSWHPVTIASCRLQVVSDIYLEAIVLTKCDIITNDINNIRHSRQRDHILLSIALFLLHSL